MSGVVVGVLFDFYRSLRRWLGWGRVATWGGDLIFSLASLVILFRFFQRANALDFRIYILWGSVLGLIAYLRLVSKVMVKMYFQLYRFISYLIWLIGEGLKIPIRGIFFLMRPPYALLRWFSLLIFRMLESLLSNPLRQMKIKLANWGKFLFPPRTKG